MQPGISTLSSGSFASRHTAHSWRCRGFAASNKIPAGFALSTIAQDLLERNVVIVRPFVIRPQQMCMRIRSAGMSRTAWLSASTWYSARSRNSFSLSS